jgi:hypothetical protein
MMMWTKQDRIMGHHVDHAIRRTMDIETVSAPTMRSSMHLTGLSLTRFHEEAIISKLIRKLIRLFVAKKQ